MTGAIGSRALLAAIGAGAVVVLFLWWHSTLAIVGLGGWLTGAGEILGLLAGYGVIILVLLSAASAQTGSRAGTPRAAGT
jgi:hypothetical protein